MQYITAILFFYRKLLIPTAVTAFCIAFLGMLLAGSFSLNTLGIAYILSTFLLQYFIYELRYPDEYYFYYNLGLNKTTLWISTILISTGIALIFFAL